MIHLLKTRSALLTALESLSLQPCSLVCTRLQPQLLPQYAGEYWRGKDSVFYGSVRHESPVSILQRPSREEVPGSHWQVFGQGSNGGEKLTRPVEWGLLVSSKYYFWCFTNWCVICLYFLVIWVPKEIIPIWIERSAGGTTSTATCHQRGFRIEYECYSSLWYPKLSL